MPHVKPPPQLTKEQMAGPAGGVFTAVAFIGALAVVTLFTAFCGLFSRVPYWWVITLCVTWVAAANLSTRWIVQSRRYGIRPRGRRAIWIATGVTAYIAWVAAGGIDVRGSALVVWPLGIYAGLAAFREAVDHRE